MDLQKFEKAKFTPRHKDVAVPQLAEFFADGEPAVWTVRSLTGAELGWVDDNQTRGDDLKALVKALAGDGDKGDELRQFLALDPDQTSAQTRRHIDMVTVGSVSPALGADKRSVAVRLAENYPGLLRVLAQTIAELTGQGAEVGKPKGSGNSQRSASE